MNLWKTMLAFAFASLLAGRAASAEEIAFRRQTINAASEFSSCAVFDVNRDGKLDIFCGGWWYEAPNWKKHFVRDVENIRGRFDDYSNQSVDVDGDGWTDVISVNYRSASLYWVKHPGKSLGKWTKHMIDRPGPSETGRLHDIDGDGRLDLLPNGVKSAAWYEFLGKGDAVKWVRHELPPEAAGHGVGFGDIDGDGRGDVVGPRGWLQAPKDRRKGRWVWHPEFTLHRDGSVPILVTDVDRDGDADLIWARAHNIGLYWLEQTKNQDSGRAWTKHVIDTSWSQSHSLLLADVDGDGQDELIAGKRYLAHGGKDPAEYDPLVIYWYDFQKPTRTWRRGTISPRGMIGFDLDPKAVDIDGDGDLDVIAASRNGLHLLENLRVHRPGDQAPAPKAPRPPRYQDHSRLLHIAGSAGSRPIQTRFDWRVRRDQILAGMEQAMGPLPGPEQRVPLDLRVLKSEPGKRYVRQTITFAAEPGNRVPAYLLIPNGLREKAPAMLCLHQTTRIGKGEPAGLGGRGTLHYAHELARRGYVCLVPDYPSFGDYTYDFKKQGAHYASGSMKAIWNNLRAVDLLESLPQVNADRMGCIGHSLGGHNALFTAAFDQRLQAIVTSCGFTAFHHYYGGKLAGWTSDRYMPRIRDRYQNDPDKVPFDFYGVIAALAPRAVFINAPQHDGNFELTGVKKVVEKAKAVYAFVEAKDKLRAVYPDSGHDFPDAIRQEVYDWLDKQLK